MADNTTLNSGTGGDTIATDDIGGVKHQRVKIQHGADGSATDVSAASPLPVDGSGATQPVSGTVTANLSATDNAVLDSIDTATTGILADTAAIQTAVETIDNAISGTEMQVDVVAPLPAGTNAIGKLAANSGVDIGDVDVTSQPARDRLTDNVGVALQTDAMLSDTTALTPKFAAIDDAVSGDNTLVAAVVGKKIRVLSAFLMAAGTVNARFEDGAAGTALTGQMNLVANAGFVLPFNPIGWFETTANTLLNLELSAAISVDGCLTYVEV